MSKFRSILFAFCLAVAIVIAEEAWARAGGGGRNSGGGILALILWPFFALASWLIGVRVRLRHKKIALNLEQLAQIDPTWRMEDVLAKVEQAFFALQNAWTERNQDLARDFMSERLYQKHKMQTDAMIKQDRQNVLENVNLHEVKLVSFDDRVGEDNDHFVAFIEASMVDYMVKASTGEKINEGKKDCDKDCKNTAFREFWHFKKENGKWVVDAIDQQANWSDFKMFKSQSHQFR